MTTWKLWRRIVQPRDSAVYRLARRQAGPAIPWYVGCAELFAFVLILPLILFIGTIYSFGWVVGMSGDIARARENGTFDLLALTPAGPLSAAFALAAGGLHRIGALERINQRAMWAGRLTVAGLLAYFVVIAPRLQAGEPILGVVVSMLLVTLALYPDQVQSVALAVVAAMVGAEASTHRGTVQWTAFVLLLAFQMGAYGAALSVFLLLVGDDPLRVIGATVAALVTLLLMREALFVLLWRALANRFGAATVLDLADGQGV